MIEDLGTGKNRTESGKSDNLNFNLSYNRQLGKHGLYVETGLIYGILPIISIAVSKQRATVHTALTATMEVLKQKAIIFPRVIITPAGSVSAETLHKWDVRDNVEKTQTGQESLTYGARMPNLPYRFANSGHLFLLAGPLEERKYAERYL